MANIKISEITEITTPVERFNFLGVDMTNSSTPINNTMSYNTLSTNIYNTTYAITHDEIDSKVGKLSDDLSADFKVNALYNESKFNELKLSIEDKANKEYLDELSSDFKCISGLLCSDIGISVDTLLLQIDLNLLSVQDVSTILSNQIDIVKNAIPADLCVKATDNSLGMVKFRISDTKPDEDGYIKYGLTADSDGKAYVRILSSATGGGGGGGSTPIGYNLVVLSATYGTAAKVLLTSIDIDSIKALSDEYKWYYTTDETSTDKIMLLSAKDEIVKLIKAASNNITKSDIATSDDAGIIRLGYPTTGTKYGISADTEGKAYVDVPTNAYILSAAESNKLGGIKTGYSTTGTKYGINVDKEGNAYVDVPAYTLQCATSTAYGGIKTGYTQSGNDYAVNIAEVGDNAGKAFVTIPNIGSLTTEMLNQIYPVGSVYISVFGACPFQFGKWTNITDSSATQWTTVTILAYQRTE